ncbi:DUF2917 domain-containing protein [Derxia gummosa]|uniref:DUF2917 domain-containing protein n=1 Tax=Derxia gummosa DSM 723 TaxID=1121388 RepID=A0A8B6X2D6_9BURK|nr:DUF2917 domain-containing protein [Derxia gummosa]
MTAKQDGALALDAGSAVTLEAARGSVLCVRRGRVWITETGSASGDHVLDAGMCLRASGAGPFVVEAWSDARVELLAHPVAAAAEFPAVGGAVPAGGLQRLLDAVAPLALLRRLGDRAGARWRRTVAPS